MTTFASLAQPSDPNSAPAPSGSQESSGGGGGMWQMLFLILPIIMIFWMMRSQNKKQKDLETNLKVGDRVFTRGGAIGKIIRKSDRSIDLELAPGVVVAFRREAVEGLDVTDPKKEDSDKDKDKDKDKDREKDGKKKDDKDADAPKDSKEKEKRKG